MSQSTQDAATATRRWRRFGGVTVAIGAVLVAAGCANAPAAPPPAAPASTAPDASKHAAKGIAGRITAENGPSWTVVTAKGKQFTVSITPQTVFGTKRSPSTAQQLTTGMTVRVTGTPDGSTITAVRVAVPAHPAGSKAPSATTPPTTAPA